MTRLTPFQRQCRALTEREAQKAYVAAARAVGCLVNHTYDSRFTDPGSKGYPDLTIVAETSGAAMWVEWKREEGVVSAEQIRWHDALRRGGKRVEVYRPSDWDRAMGELEEFAQAPIPVKLRAFPVPKVKKRRRAKKPAAPPAAASSPPTRPARRRSTRPGASRS